MSIEFVKLYMLEYIAYITSEYIIEIRAFILMIMEMYQPIILF